MCTLFSRDFLYSRLFPEEEGDCCCWGFSAAGACMWGRKGHRGKFGGVNL